MIPNLDALRLKERQDIAYLVNDFLKDCDAILAMKESRSIPWRIQWLAEKAFLDCVELRQQLGCLLYLHDGSTLKKGA